MSSSNTRRRGTRAARHALVATLACLALPVTSHAGLPPWADSDGPSFDAGTQVLTGGPSVVAKGYDRRALRFFSPPSSEFRQWSPPSDEFGDPYSVDAFAATPSGAAWVQLDIDDDTVLGFERVGSDGSILTPVTNPCPQWESAESVSLIAAGSDERAWVQCETSLATIAADGTKTTVRCAVCGDPDGPTVPSANGKLWAVDEHQDESWDIRLIDPVTGVVAARSFQGSAPQELVDAGTRIYWLRARSGTRFSAARVLESIDAATWLTSGTTVVRQGTSEAIGRAKDPVDPYLQSLVSNGDGSVWLAAFGFRRVVHVEASGAVSELPADGTVAGSPVGMVFAIGDRIWAWMGNQHLVRVSATPQPTLPILSQQLRFRVGNYTNPIGLLTSVGIESSHLVPGTRVTVKCLSACAGHQASAAANGSTVRVNASLTLNKGAKVAVVSSHPGYRASTTVYELRRNKKRTKIVIRIVKIDATAYKNLILCGC